MPRFASMYPLLTFPSIKLFWLAEPQGFLKWFDVSAKANINIDKAARFLVERILGDTSYQNTLATYLSVSYQHTL